MFNLTLATGINAPSMAFYAALIISMLFTLLLIPPLMRYAGLIGAVDQPNERKVHAKAIPRIGGIAMIIGSLVPILIWLPLEAQNLAIAASILVIFFFGVWDDRKELSYKLKFLGQALAAAIVVFWGDIYIAHAPFMGGAALPEPLAYGLTIFCLLAITNALNLADGLDGLAGGSTVLSFGVIGVLCLGSNAPYILMVAMAVIGGVLGFLRFNSHPATIFMGDAGSQFLGFIMGVELILLTQSADPMLSKTLPLLVIGIPLLDTLTVMVRRMMAGRSPFSADKNHLHHRLLGLGLSHYETVVVIYFIQSSFVLSAFFTAYSSDWVPLLLFVGYVFLILSVLARLEKRGIQFNNEWLFGIPGEQMVVFKQWVSGVAPARYLPAMLLATTPALTLYSTYHSPVNHDISLMALILGALFTLSALAKKQSEWRDRVCAYTFCAMITYLGYKKQDMSEIAFFLQWGFVAIAALWVVISIFITKIERFETTPLDILLILLAMLVPYFAKAAVDLQHLSLDIVKFMVLIYLFEYLINSGIFYRIKAIPIMLASCSLIVAGSNLVTI